MEMCETITTVYVTGLTGGGRNPAIKGLSKLR